MSISKELHDAINKQIGIEFHASYSYLSMAAYFEETSWDGFANWMSLQSQEEHEHAMKFYTYLLDRGASVILPALEAPKVGYESPLDAFETSLAQEISVTKSIHDLYKLAHQQDDYATVSFLKFFVDEQVEEEKAASDMIDKIKRAGDNPDALLLIDSLAGERTPE